MDLRNINLPFHIYVRFLDIKTGEVHVKMINVLTDETCFNTLEYCRGWLEDWSNIKSYLPTPPDTTTKNVHTEHCCILHGCKYGDEDCPVASGQIQQSHSCEDCRRYKEVDF